MKTLSTATVNALASDVLTPVYDSQSVVAGIVHFGVGNFHRAHQAVYCDTLLNLGESRWGITGISLRSPGVRNNLAPQDYLYAQPTLGETTEYRIIGSIKNILVAPENPTAVIHAVVDQQTQLVSTTITEKGYCLANGEIDLTHSDIVFDLTSIDAPKTVYGYLAAALIKRFTLNQAPLTVLCCDNINAGGEHLHNGVQLLIDKHAPENAAELSAWISKKVAFSASMVDRVTPATNDGLKQQVAEKIGVSDSSPVAAEPFTQWVIEDNFAGARPPFDRAGAIFVKHIAPFERVKLRFLNASHSMLSVLGYLAGDVYVHEALKRSLLAEFTERALKDTVLPVTHVPEGIDGSDYIDQVLTRFRNGHLPYAVLQVSTDSSQKIQLRWYPSIDDAITQHQDSRYLAFALAAWVHFIRKALTADDLNDPLIESFSNHLHEATESDVHNFLVLAGAEPFLFFKNIEFMTNVNRFHASIAHSGIEPAIQTLLNNN